MIRFHLHVASPNALEHFALQPTRHLLRSGSHPLLQACSAGREMELDAKLQCNSDI
jgi:hypothetical protein